MKHDPVNISILEAINQLGGTTCLTINTLSRRGSDDKLNLAINKNGYRL